MKILFCGTYTGLSTGYARISHSITNFLCDHHEVFHMAIQAYDDIDRSSNQKITVIKEKGFGYENINNYVQEIKPDVVILYNDLIVCSHYVSQFLASTAPKKEFKLVVYLDITYKGSKYVHHLNKLTDTFVCFNKSWERYLTTCGIPPEKLTTIEHEVRVVNAPSVSESRKAWSLAEEDFVVLNLNRNSYRKLLDITIDAFLQFFKKNNFAPNIKLFLGCKFTKEGWIDVQSVVQMYARLNGYEQEELTFVLNNSILRSPADHMSDEAIRMLYNACDVGINTCGGEGYGLCNVEHQLFGKPQILTRIDTFDELFDAEWCRFLPVKTRIAMSHVIDDPLYGGHVGGTLEIPDAKDAAKAMDFYYKNPEIRTAHGARGRRAFEENRVDMHRSEERRVGKECRSRWSPYH